MVLAARTVPAGEVSTPTAQARAPPGSLRGKTPTASPGTGGTKRASNGTSTGPEGLAAFLLNVGSNSTFPSLFCVKR